MDDLDKKYPDFPQPFPTGAELSWDGSGTGTFDYRFEKKPLERRQRDHMSRQFTYVMHGTQTHIPPHVKEEGEPSFHAGTSASADSRMAFNAPYHFKHLYRIHRDAVDPTVFGDYMEEGSYEKGMKGLQTGLFETIPFNSKEATEHHKKSGLVLPYRNNQEDRGSISFLVPKSRIGNGVEYLGMGSTHRLSTPEEIQVRDEAHARFAERFGEHTASREVPRIIFRPRER
jgi:hypothetical protein